MRFRGWFPPQRALLRGRVDRYKFVFSGRDGRILREKSLRNVENVSQAFSRDIGSPVCSIAIVLPLDRAWSEPLSFDVPFFPSALFNRNQSAEDRATSNCTRISRN